jgi:hypothetical protein
MTNSVYLILVATRYYNDNSKTTSLSTSSIKTSSIGSKINLSTINLDNG